MSGIKNFDPADYTAAPAATLKDKARSTIDDVAVFVGKYISEDCMGSVSNARLVLADISAEGPRSKDALELSEACSIAVDFQKSGNNVDLTKRLDKVIVRPDWMRPPLSVGFLDRRGEFYISKKLLGQLFNTTPQITFKEVVYTNAELGAFLTKIFQDKKFLDSDVSSAPGDDTEIFEFLNTSYRPKLWDICEQGQLCGICLDEVDLFLLSGSSGADLSPDHIRLSDRLSTLIVETDAFFESQIGKYNRQTDKVKQAIFYYRIW
jgi:RNA dependent RNA polymerase